MGIGFYSFQWEEFGGGERVHIERESESELRTGILLRLRKERGKEKQIVRDRKQEREKAKWRKGRRQLAGEIERERTRGLCERERDDFSADSRDNTVFFTSFAIETKK